MKRLFQRPRKSAIPLSIGKLLDGPFDHTFGAKGWDIHAPKGVGFDTRLLLVLDLRDPKVPLGDGSLDLLPVAARIDVETDERQSYCFDSDAREIVFDHEGWEPSSFTPEYMLPPLRERRLTLRDPRPSEDPAVSSEEDMIDSFLCARGFMRFGGHPLWLQDPEEVSCTCRRPMLFVACLGSEDGNKPVGFVEKGEPFFLGEMGLYFFACLDCRRVTVLEQST